MGRVGSSRAAAAVALVLLAWGAGTGRAEEAAPSGAVRVTHGPSFGLATADGDFSLHVYGYGQARYTYTDNDHATDQSGFTVQRARLGFKGNAYGRDLTYQLFLNVYSGKADGPVSLFDFFVDNAVNSHIALKAGQYKVPYAVQWNVSAAELQFTERGDVDAYFRLDRDTGLSAHGAAAEGLSYDVGVFNGEGTNRTNPDNRHLWVARLSAAPLGTFAPHEADVEADGGRSAAPRVLLVAGVAYDDHVASHSVTALNGRLAALGPSDLLTWNLFAAARHRGGEVRAEYHRRVLDPVSPGGAGETAQGLSVQGGYRITPGVEAALRWEYLDPDTHAGGDLTREGGVAVSRYFAGHRSKLQADLFRIHTQTAPGADTDANRLRVQYQIAF
jgi:phosphate-selective porin OprO/OprP